MQAVRENGGADLPELVLELRAALKELSQAYRRLDYVMDPDLVEYCVYQINAASARCDYLYRTVKDLKAAEEARASPVPEPEELPGMPRTPFLRAALARRNGEKEDGRWI